MKRLLGTVLVVAVAATATGCIGLVANQGSSHGSTTLRITTTTLPTGSTDVSYNAAFTAVNGVPPYTWSLSTGQFPPGLELEAPSGLISGTPTQPGAFPFLVQVQDSSGQTKSANLSINISGDPQSLLAGCTVSATNSVQTCANTFPPAGWTPGYAQGFEGSVSEFTIGAIDSTIAHTGSKSLNTICTGDQCTDALFYNVGSASDVYISQWRYYADGATQGQDHFFFRLYLYPEDTEQCVLDPQDQYAKYITRTAPVTMVCNYNPQTINGVDAADYGDNWTIPWGSWHQYEFWFHASTTCTGKPESSSGSLLPGDGFYRFYIDGQLQMSDDNVNMTNCVSFRNNPHLFVEVGLLLSTFYWANSSGRCLPLNTTETTRPTPASPWSRAPRFQVDGVSPCWGSQPNFKVAIDDIIIMTR